MVTYSDIVAFWQGRRIASAEELAAAIHGKIVALAYHSGKIENDAVTYHDTREIFDHDGVTGYTGDLQDLGSEHRKAAAWTPADKQGTAGAAVP